MKKMMISMMMVALLAIGLTTSARAQITGVIDMNFPARTAVDSTGKAVAGVTNTYDVAIQVANEVYFNGRISSLPTILSSGLGRELQTGQVEYNLNTGIVNPTLGKTAELGKVVGTVKISKEGVYRFDEGNVSFSIMPFKTVPGFKSTFSGSIQGLPVKDESLLGATMEKSQKVRQLTRMSGGKLVKRTLGKYDIMTYRGVKLAAGPKAAYVETVVNGDFPYEEAVEAWHLDGVMIGTNRLSGFIRWIKDPAYLSNGESYYSFDVRFNEKPVDVSAVAFSEGNSDDAYWATETNIPGLTGTIKFKDSFSGDEVIRSVATWNITATQVSSGDQVSFVKFLLTALQAFFEG